MLLDCSPVLASVLKKKTERFRGNDSDISTYPQAETCK